MPASRMLLTPQGSIWSLPRGSRWRTCIKRLPPKSGAWAESSGELRDALLAERSARETCLW